MVYKVQRSSTCSMLFVWMLFYGNISQHIHVHVHAAIHMYRVCMYNFVLHKECRRGIVYQDIRRVAHVCLNQPTYVYVYCMFALPD